MTRQGGGVSPSQKSVKLGENYGELPVPTRAGYVFCGWRNASNEYVTADMQYIIIGPEKLTAHWRQPIAYLSSDWKTRITNAATPTSANLSGSKDDYVLTAGEYTDEVDPSYPFVTVTITSNLSAASGLSNSLSIGTNNETSTDAFSSGEYFYDVTAYFDNNKQTVVIYSPYTIYAPASCYDLFGYCDKMTSVTFGNLNTSKTTNMQGMFVKNRALTSIDVSTFDTSNVTTMRYLFQDCSALTSINVSNFNVSKVSDMTSMFYNCSAATTINVSGLNTSNVTKMTAMFYHCSSVTSLAVSGFNTSKVTDMSQMFDGCTKLVTADTSGFDGTKCTNYGYMYMFRNCAAYKTAVLPKGLVTTGVEMYYNCTSLSSVTLPTTCTTISNTTFRDTDSLKSIDLKNVKTINTDAFWSGGLTGELVCPASNIGFDAFGSNKLTSVKFTHAGTITLGKTAFRNNSSLTTLDFLAQGTNFKSNSFSTEGEGVWSGCDIKYVKVTQGNFGKELMALSQIIEVDDKEMTTGYTYIYVPGYVYFHYTVNCWGWTWTAYSTPELQGGSGTEKNLPTISVTCGMFAGDTEKSSTATEQGSGLPAKYGSLAVRVYNSCTKGGSLVKVAIYGIGSLSSTEWNKIVSSGYNFRCNATAYALTGHASIASNMNAYCYPNYLDYWICQY